jgi:hypothetical protein
MAEHFVLVYVLIIFCMQIWGRPGRDRMVDEFTTICAISAYHH